METLDAVDWLSEFRSVVPDEAAAVRYFSEKRWRRGEFCIYCGFTKLSRQPTLDRYRCARCDRTFSIGVRTVLHRSRQSLRQWLAAIWLATNAEKAVTIRMLSEALKIKTSAAWHMLSQLRCAGRTQSFLRGAAPGFERHSRAPNGNDCKAHYDHKLKFAMSFDEAVEIGRRHNRGNTGGEGTSIGAAPAKQGMAGKAGVHRR